MDGECDCIVDVGECDCEYAAINGDVDKGTRPASSVRV